MIRSLRLRIQIWNGLILAAVIVVFGCLFYAQQRHIILQSCEEEVRTNVAILANKLNAIPRNLLVDYLVSKAGDQLPVELRRKLVGFQRRGPEPNRPRRARDMPPPSTPPQKDWLGFIFGPPVDFITEKIEEFDRSLALPEAAFHQLGRRPQDQPYFAIFLFDGTPIKSTSYRLPLLPVVQSVDRLDSPVKELEITTIRQGAQLEAFAPANLGTTVVVGRDIQFDLDRLTHTGWWIAGSGLVTWVLGLAGSWFLSRGTTRPITSIGRVAAEISESQLHGRIDVDAMDVEFVELSETLNKTFSRLEAAIARQRQFTSDASHELRTPLAVLQAQQELALSKPRTPEEYQTTLKTCVRAVERMNQLVESLLLLARVDSNQDNSEFESFDISRLIENELKNVEISASTNQVKLINQSTPLVIEARKTQIRCVVNNLLTNAIASCSKDDEVTIAVHQVDQSVAVRVIDTGEGISREDMGRIFDRFYRVNKERSRKKGGLGIGLSLCKSIVEHHDGTIQVTSELGTGTEFEFLLPIRRSDLEM